MKKVILEGDIARKKIISGALTVSRILGSTLGPRGRNVIIQKPYSAPEIVNDAGTIARHIVLQDPTEDLGAQTIVEATMKTNDRAGDARTTTAVIAGKIIETSIKSMGAQSAALKVMGHHGKDVIAISRSILTQKDVVIEKLREAAKKLKKGELKNVVSTSIGKLYPEYVEGITEMVEQVGINGYISVEDNFGTKYGVENTIIAGMRFLGSYASVAMMTDIEKKEGVYEGMHILVTNHHLDSVIPFGGLVNALRAKGIKKLLIIAERFDRGILDQIVASYVKQAQSIRQGQPGDFFQFVFIKAPSLTTEQFEDISVFCNAKFFNKNMADNDVSLVTADHLGYAEKIIIQEDDTIIKGGSGKIEARLKLLNAELESEKDSAFKEQLKRRIGALTSGFGMIRVGASTETERGYVKKKINDSVNSAKGALEEGVVKGGGLALKEIAEELGRENVLYEALMEPYRLIQETTEGAKIPATVVDPLKSLRLAVENACSVAAHLITCEASIADVRDTLWDQLENKLSPKDEDDFRAEENQELKYR